MAFWREPRRPTADTPARVGADGRVELLSVSLAPPPRRWWQLWRRGAAASPSHMAGVHRARMSS